MTFGRIDCGYLGFLYEITTENIGVSMPIPSTAVDKISFYYDHSSFGKGT